MRIQILPLPSVVKGDEVEEPFALVVDQCESGLYADREAGEWAGFKEAIGARGVLVTPETVEVVDPYAVPGASEIDRLADYLLKHFGDEIGEGSAVDNAIRLLGGILLRRDAVKIRDEIRFMQTAREGKPGDEARRRAESDRIDNDRLRLEIDRLRGIVSRVVEIPREPETLPAESGESDSDPLDLRAAGFVCTSADRPDQPPTPLESPRGRPDGVAASHDRRRQGGSRESDTSAALCAVCGRRPHHAAEPSGHDRPL